MDNSTPTLVAYLIVWTVFSALSATWAHRRGQSATMNFIISFLLSPVVGFILAAVQGDKKKKAV